MESGPCLLRPGEVVLAKDFRPKKPRIRMEGPDGGWAWFVAFAAFIINFIMAGLGRMSGILYVAFINIFHVDRKGAAYPFSIRSSTRNLLGPLVGILGQKYSVRSVSIIGGIIGTLSAASCFYTKDMLWITIIWGGVNGFGTALTTTLPQVVIGQYFKRHLTTASGMAFSGGCVGSFLFPVLLEYLLQNYGLSGTFLIIGGIIMHVIPAAMILKKPPWLSSRMKADEEGQVGFSDPGKGGLDNAAAVVEDFTPVKQDKVVDIKSTVSDYATPKKNPVIGRFVGRRKKLPIEVSKEDVDVQFLRDNMQLVWKVLIGVVRSKEAEGTKCLCKTNVCEEVNANNEGFRDDECPVAKELEDMYKKIEKIPDHHDIENRVVYHVVNESPYSPLCHGLGECHKAHHAFTPKSQSLEYDSPKMPGLANYHAKSMSELNQSSDQIRRLFVLTLLSEIPEEESEIPEKQNPPDSDQEESPEQKVVRELRKVYKQISCIKKAEINTPYYLASSDSVRKSLSNTDLEITPPKQSPINPAHRTKDQNGFLDHIKTAVKLYKNPVFLLISLCRAVHFMTFIPVVTTVVDFGMDKGLLEEDGKYIIGALSVGDLLGRLALGWVTDRGYVSLPRYMLSVMVMQGASTATLPLMRSRATILPAIALFGLLQGSVFVRHPVLVSTYMGRHEQSIAMGCINFLSGFIGFGLPSYIGYFRDTLGSYDNMFYITGAIGTSVGLLWALEPYCAKFTPRSDSDSKSPDTTAV